MESRTFRDTGLTREALIQNLISSGIEKSLAESMAKQAAEAGQLDEVPGASLDISADVREEAESEAVTVALGVEESRTTLDDLEDKTDATSERGQRYRSRYRASLERASVEAVELIDTFPVLTGNFGYTRGGTSPGESRLVPFTQQGGRYALYAELGVTEALFFRLQPSAVARWLVSRGAQVERWSDERSARLAIVNAGPVPGPGAQPDGSAGSLLLTLVHSFAHRLIRLLAVYAGIDREALSELLVPIHQGFFVYAATRGEFVLGGLQAVFESGLDDLLTELSDGEMRCPLDPGCRRHGGACMACLHIGEPSCRYFNGFLDRGVLDIPDGYLGNWQE